MIYYVSNNGNDSALGTQEAPFLTISRAAELAVAGERRERRRSPHRDLSTDDPGLGHAGRKPREVAGVEISEGDRQSGGQKRVFNIAFGVEIPDEVEQEDILGDFFKGGHGFVGAVGLQHIGPNHHLQAFFCEISV